MAESLEIICRVGGMQLVKKMYPDNTGDIESCRARPSDDCSPVNWCTRGQNHDGPHVDTWCDLVWEENGPVYKVKD